MRNVSASVAADVEHSSSSSSMTLLTGMTDVIVAVIVAVTVTMTAAVTMIATTTVMTDSSSVAGSTTKAIANRVHAEATTGSESDRARGRLQYAAVSLRSSTSVKPRSPKHLLRPGRSSAPVARPRRNPQSNRR